MNLILKNKSIKNKKVAVIGAGKSGLSVCKLLKKLEAKVFLSEKNNKKNIKELEKYSDNFEIGIHSERILNNELIVIALQILSLLLSSIKGLITPAQLMI